MIKALIYREYTTIVTAGMQLPVHKGANGFTAINNGDVIVWINGIPLKPPPVATVSGEAVAIGGNYGEIYSAANIKVVFNSGGATPSVIIIQKVYSQDALNELGYVQ